MDRRERLACISRGCHLARDIGAVVSDALGALGSGGEAELDSM
jgi:hypothetical protein